MQSDRREYSKAMLGTGVPRPRQGEQQRLIGIVGGLGPFAHLELERRLLQAMPHAAADQDYPAWMVSSIPATPSLASAILDGGPSPVPALLTSLERLASCADFGIIACNTAHVFFPELARLSALPLVHLIEEVVRHVAVQCGADARVGVLGVTAMLESALYPQVACRVAPQLRWLRLHDLDDGARLHEDLTMRPIYGRPRHDGSRDRSGIKDGGERDSQTGRSHRDSLAEAVDILLAAGACCVVVGCTEISIALGSDPVRAPRLVDPLAIAADVALAIAYGERALPSRQAEAVARR